MIVAYPVRLAPDEGCTLLVQGCEPLTGVLTFGNDRDHALVMAREALTGVLDAMLDAGQDIPRPERISGPDIVYVEPEPTTRSAILKRWAMNQR